MITFSDEGVSYSISNDSELLTVESSFIESTIPETAIDLSLYAIS